MLFIRCCLEPFSDGAKAGMENARRGEAMCVFSNNEAPSCNHCCSGKAVGTTYCECVFVALVIEHVTRMHHIVICNLSGCTIFFYIIP